MHKHILICITNIKKEQDLIAYKSLSGLITAEEARIQAVKLANTGKKQSKEHIRKRVKARLITRPNSTLGQKNKPCSEERKVKISLANKGGKGRPRPHSSLTKIQMSESAKKRPLLKCPKCGVSMQKANLSKHHGLNGEKCKN